MPVSSQTCCAMVLPMPKMYVSAISNRFSRGMSTPEIRAMRSPSALALLVTGVRADDAHRPVPADHLALLADLLDGRTDLHGRAPWRRHGPRLDSRFGLITCSGR